MRRMPSCYVKTMLSLRLRRLGAEDEPIKEGYDSCQPLLNVFQ